MFGHFFNEKLKKKKLNVIEIIMQEDRSSYRGDLLADFEDSLLEQRPNCMSGSGLSISRENRFQSHIQHRLAELEG